MPRLLAAALPDSHASGSVVEACVAVLRFEELNAWTDEQGLPRGEIAYDFADPESGAQHAVFDLAWPHGIQEELSQPVAVLLSEGSDVIALAKQAGYRCFVRIAEFKRYALTDILGAEETPDVSAGGIMPRGDLSVR